MRRPGWRRGRTRGRRQNARSVGRTSSGSAAAAPGEVVVTPDADLQNDPADIPRLLAKLEEGYDVVSGWRKDRRDNGLLRIAPSRIANWLISRITGVPLHDLGCTLKAYRREVAQRLRLYGEMHRFSPIHASQEGARGSTAPGRCCST